MSPWVGGPGTFSNRPPPPSSRHAICYSTDTASSVRTERVTSWRWKKWWQRWGARRCLPPSLAAASSGRLPDHGHRLGRWRGSPDLGNTTPSALTSLMHRLTFSELLWYVRDPTCTLWLSMLTGKMLVIDGIQFSTQIIIHDVCSSVPPDKKVKRV